MLIENITSNIIAKALDVSAFNHKVIANNIANIGVKEYKAGRLSFDQVMQELRLLVNNEADDTAFHDALNKVSEKEAVEFSSTDTDISLEREMLLLTENTLRYQTLLQARSELGKILKSAISGGAR